jgi:methyltransferase (TIGR00027 family)
VTAVPTGVGRTALGVAMVRAMESRRRDRLFHDPHAAAFLAAAPAVFGAERAARRGAVAGLSGLSSAGAAFWSHVVIRTRFFDDYLLDATTQGVTQVVLLAAGLDTRAHRLAWPSSVRLFELDLPEVLTFKRRVLSTRSAEPRCDLRPVPVDLRQDWAAPLIAEGMRPDQPTAWLLEGLLIYLSAEEVVRLLTTVGELSATGSRAAFEFEQTDAETFRERARLQGLADYAALWKGGLPDAPGWLAAHGWRLQTHWRADVAAGYGRTMTETAPGGFVTATRE